MADMELLNAVESLERSIAGKEDELNRLRHALQALRGAVVVIGSHAQLPQSKEYASLGGLEAARRFIRAAGKPLTTRELVDGMLERGWTTKSRNVTATIYATLTNAKEEWKRNPRGEWEYLGGDKEQAKE